MNSQDHLSKLLYLCFRLIESETDKPCLYGEAWRHDAQAFGVKLFRHITSAQQISMGVTIDFGNNSQLQHVDHSSVAVLIRSAIEAYLAFNYIFINTDASLSEYRHDTWQLAGLLDRSKITANRSESKEKLAQEALLITEIKQKLERSSFFVESNSRTRKNILDGKWKPVGGWNKLGGDADIHQAYFDNIYNHLSGHSHASYISILQIKQAESVEDQSSLAVSTNQIGCVIISHFLFSYVKLFPDTKRILEGNSSLYEVAKKWHLRTEDVNSIYGENVR